MRGKVVAVAASPEHAFSKPVAEWITLKKGLGVEGDAHCGVTVKHRSRVAADPSQPNLRQVHLIHLELIEQLQAQGFAVAAGTMGENITTLGLDLLALPRGARLKIGDSAEIEITGLRNPCAQLDQFQTGLMRAVVEKSPDGALVRKAGVMGVVSASGVVRAADPIIVILPPEPHERLERV